MKVVLLRAENVKRIRTIEIKPDPKKGLVVIAGRNAQGKSSAMDSMWYVVAGGKAIPPEPVRHGEETAEATVVLDGGGSDLLPITVTRKWVGQHKSYLHVWAKDGEELASPQTVLDSFRGQLTFDPLAFARLPAKEQRETLLGCVDLDIDLDKSVAAEDRATSVRKSAKSEAKRATTLWHAMTPVPVGTPDELVSSQEILAELKAAREINAKNQRARADCEEDLRELEATRQQIANMKEELEAVLGAEAALCQKIHKGDWSMGNSVDIDEAAIEGRLGQVEAINEQVRARKAWKEAGDEAKGAEAKAKDYDKQVATIRKQRESALKRAEFPIQGLSVGVGGVLMNEVPFEQLSSSEQLRVSIAIAMALNPTLRVLRIDNGSLLDQDAMKLIAETAEANDYQIWIERIGEGEECGIIIEDGEIKEIVDGQE